MFVSIIKYVLFGLIAFLVLLWLLGGGIHKTTAFAHGLIDPISGAGKLSQGIPALFSLGSIIHLPGQPKLNLEYNSLPNGVPGDIDIPQQIANDTQTFGEQSPHREEVSMRLGNINTPSAVQQYLQITSNPTNISAINLNGWSLQSVISGKRAFLPQASSPYVLGTINAPTTVWLEPGDSVFVYSGASPLGVSFRETMCTGYLNELYQFTPQLSTARCPQALRAYKYGTQCVAYASTIPSCSFPQQLPGNLSTQCRNYLTADLSYQGCTNAYQRYPEFSSAYWRLYLGYSSPVWQAASDTIRLLDEYGRIVTAISY